MKNLFALLVLFPSLSLAALPNDIPFSPADPSTIDFEKTVSIGKLITYAIFGYADYEEVEKYLQGTGYTPRKHWFGKAQVSLNFSYWNDIKGCSCPQAFNEFIMTIESVKNGMTQFVPDFVISSDQMRVNSLTTKFGTFSNLGEIKIAPHQLYARSANGETEIQVEAGDIPKHFLISTDFNANFLSLGGITGDTLIPQKEYRLYGPARVAFSVPFSFNISNTIHISPGSRLDQTLKRLKFSPKMWQVLDVDNGWAWLP